LGRRPEKQATVNGKKAQHEISNPVLMEHKPLFINGYKSALWGDGTPVGHLGAENSL
jgi:hypothetical protein